MCLQMKAKIKKVYLLRIKPVENKTVRYVRARMPWSVSDVVKEGHLLNFLQSFRTKVITPGV